MLQEASVSVKSYQLSKKEQEAKRRLMTGQSSKSNTPNRTPTITPDISQNISKNSNSQSISFTQPSQVSAKIMIQDQQLDQFVKDVQNDMKKVQNNDVSIQMIANQQRLMQQQNEILNENQKQLAKLASLNIQSQSQVSSVSLTSQSVPNSSLEAKKKELYDSNVQMMRQLLEPVNEQLKEIKAMYDLTLRTSNVLKNQLSDSNTNEVQNGMKHFNEQNNQLRGMLDTAQHNLTFLQPENLNALQNFSNFNMQVYSDTISNLQRQIEMLQIKQQEAEDDLIIKYKQLNDARTNQKIAQAKIQDELTYKELVDRVQQVDLVARAQRVQEKLGGQFDYDDFLTSVQELTSKAQQVIENFKDESKAVEIVVPQIKFDENDIQQMNPKSNSILDELREKLGMNQRPQNVKQSNVLQNYNNYQIHLNKQGSKQIQIIPNSKKPEQKDLSEIRKQAKSNISNIQPKEQIKKDFEQFLDQSEKSQQNSEKPKREEKLIYREQPIKTQPKQKEPIVKPPKRDYGTIFYVDSAQKSEISDEEPLWMISLPTKKEEQPKQIQQQQDYRKILDQSLDISDDEPVYMITLKDHNIRKELHETSQFAPQKSFEQEQNVQEQILFLKDEIEDDGVIPNPKKLEYHEFLTGKKQKQPQEENGFMDYDNLIQQIKGDMNTPQEDVQSEIMRRLGLNKYGDQDNLIQQITKDLMREKMEQIIKQQKSQLDKSSDKKQKFLINQSTSFDYDQGAPSVKPSSQDQVQQGANAMMIGLVQAFNNTLAQLNQGIYQNLQSQVPNFINGQNLESSISENSDSSGIKGEPIKPPVQTQLMPTYTFAQDFNPYKMKPIDLKEYYKQFKDESESVSHNESSISRTNRSYGSNIFNSDPSPAVIKSSESLKRTGVPLTKDIFRGLDDDLS